MLIEISSSRIRRGITQMSRRKRRHIPLLAQREKPMLSITTRKVKRSTTINPRMMRMKESRAGSTEYTSTISTTSRESECKIYPSTKRAP